MAGELTTYDLTQVTAVFGGVIVSGFDDSDSITAEGNSDDWMVKVGGDGYVSRSKSNDNTGTIKLRLMAGTPAATALGALLTLNNQVYKGYAVFPIAVTSPGTKEGIFASKCWLKKAPPMSFGKESGVREFEFSCADYTTTLGD